MVLNTVNIKGKEYVTVAERLKHFRQSPDYQGWGIEIEWIKITEDVAIAKALVKNQDGIIKSTGTAMENKDDKLSIVNKTSHVENCETSAVGRALGFLGIGIDGAEVSTYEETLRAKKRQIINSINNMIDDENIKEYEEKYKLNELGILPIDELEQIEKGLIVQEKLKLCKAIPKLMSSQMFSELLNRRKTNKLDNLDYKDLKEIHDKAVTLKFGISKKELQDLQECADIVDVNLEEYCEREYSKKPNELTKEQYQEIKRKLNK